MFYNENCSKLVLESTRPGGFLSRENSTKSYLSVYLGLSVIVRFGSYEYLITRELGHLSVN